MEKNIEILRHSCSHIMASAVKQLWPDTKLGIGPAIESGFYYDFDKKEPFTEDDLVLIESKMKEIIKKDFPFVRKEFSKDEAIKLLIEKKEDYKLGLVKEILDEKVSFYRTGDDFIDLCRGPHIDSTGEVKFFKLLSVAGAYWHGIETNPMLQRIYGACFVAKKELDIYLKSIEEAKKRDHRKLGPSLELFDIYHQEAGSGLVFYFPRGAMLRNIIEDYEKKEHIKRGYDIVITPHIMQSGLWKKSGHYDYYKENMYTFNVDDKEFVLKPMNCPGHMLIYQSKLRSYREFPLRLFELGTVYRYEKTGVLHGLLRVRGFTQDDAHIFCKREQLNDEVMAVLDFVEDVLADFGFKDYSAELSTRPEKYIGDDSDWQMATDILKKALEGKKWLFDINEGEGAFYGPKIDIKLKDALGRSWQCATIQCDFALPKRFNLRYTDTDGKQKQPIMIHRVILGSIERFIGTLVEHYAGSFPIWLAPVQAAIIPITDKQLDYAKDIEKELKAAGMRCLLDESNETLNKKVRKSELAKIPYLLVLGERERENKNISVRQKKSKAVSSMNVKDFITRIKEEIENKQ
ncbi:MAG: threonine--tRNA ligase [Candidatus Gygaella obscura]|nr:threonine--tRNA ligase [Candidatus Gygaella obscura]